MITEFAAVALALGALAFPRRLLRWRAAWRELAVALLLGAATGLVINPGAALVAFGAALLGASEARR